MRIVDRRIRRTQKSLHEAVISLVLEKNYDSITAQEILDRADVGRSWLLCWLMMLPHNFRNNELNSSVLDCDVFALF